MMEENKKRYDFLKATIKYKGLENIKKISAGSCLKIKSTCTGKTSSLIEISL
ncbi:hypothetical protein [Clostridium tagluense]|uniref:hypothetical protein n=1 Tax=Clostridium tagluense TaxID=360422 RepID=UPI001C6ECC58|nr:hypothetical protein [Clostridium tagluense]MBW9157237.1 hypothetical protein [Clostridium tagluense]WLC67163.1 hypothetical protein KTC93_08290 [Clostridium tagluense]